MDAKKEYIEFCKNNEIPLFFEPFWLEINSKNWNVIIAKDQDIILYFPYILEHKFLFNFIRSPHLTPYSGLIFNKEHILISFEIKQYLINKILQQLPYFSLLNINLHFSFNENFIFNSYDVSKKRTNILNIKNLENCYNDFKPALKRQIKKATKKLFIVENDDIELFYTLHEKTFLKLQQKPKIPFEVYKKAWSACNAYNCGKLYFIKDDLENIHASLFLVFDKSTSYYLAGGTDHTFYGSGAMSLLMWHVIEQSSIMNKLFFDFEGSDIENINRFFKNFNPVEKQYLNIQKTNSIFLKLINKK